MTASFDAAHFAHLARRLTEQGGWSPTVQAVAALAPETIGCSWAAVYRAAWERPVHSESVSDDPMLEVVATAMCRPDDGPVVTALREDVPIRIDDVQSDARWPEVGRLLAETPVRSVLLTWLLVAEMPNVLLGLYDHRSGYFTDEVAECAVTFAEHASIALGWARTRDEADGMRHGIDTSREIGKALGIVMATLKVGERDAFQILRNASGQTHRKLREIAAEVVFTGEPPAATPREPREPLAETENTPEPRVDTRPVVVDPSSS
jgi:ANTAR domain